MAGHSAPPPLRPPSALHWYPNVQRLGVSNAPEGALPAMVWNKRRAAGPRSEPKRLLKASVLGCSYHPAMNDPIASFQRSVLGPSTVRPHTVDLTGLGTDHDKHSCSTLRYGDCICSTTRGEIYMLSIVLFLYICLPKGLLYEAGFDPAVRVDQENSFLPSRR